MTTPFAASLQLPEQSPRTELAALGIVHILRVPSAATGGQLCMIEELTEPGKGPPRHIHHHQTEIFHFLEGQYEIEVDGHRMAAPPGSSAVVPPGKVHAFRNVGPSTGRFLVTLTPALEAEAFFATLAAQLGSGPPDPGKLGPILAPWGFSFAGPPLE